MPKKIHKNIAALFIVSTLNACAGLPLIGTEEAAEPEKAAATAGAPPYIWLFPNQWFPLIAYTRLGSNQARITIGGSAIDVAPCSGSPCP